jgi:lysophospholipase L1-like esterase
MGVIYIKHYPTKKNIYFNQDLLLIMAEIILIIFLFDFNLKITQRQKQHNNLEAKMTASPLVLGESVMTLSPSPAPLPTSEVINPTLIITPTLALLPNPTPSPSPTLKKEYTLAIIGDSMVDTMGERLEYLEKELKIKYPHTNFTLYNFGIGSETVEMGLKRLDQDFNYKDRHYPALTKLKPDILIVASFAYNPFFPYDRNKHWLTSASLIEKAKTISPQVYALAEIAPLGNKFGKGPNGVNLSEKEALEQANKIIEQLENIVGLSKNLNVPLIDAFHPSQADNSLYGKPEYVDHNDGIHPGVAGHQFMAKIIAQSLNLK